MYAALREKAGDSISNNNKVKSNMWVGCIALTVTICQPSNLSKFSRNLQLVLPVLTTQAVPLLFLLNLAAVQVPKKALPRGPDDLPSSIVPCIWLHCRRPTGSRKQVSIALTCRNINNYSNRNSRGSQEKS